MTTVITLVESFLGEELTPATAARLTDAPIEHLEQLAAEHLIPFYYDWLEKETESRQKDETPIYHCVDPYPKEESYSDGALLNRVKTLLLYFPTRVAVSDPLADLLWPAATAAQIRGVLGDPPALMLSEEEPLKSRVGAALRFLADIKPLVANDQVRLLPATFGLDYEVIQDRAREEMDAFESLSVDLRAKYPSVGEGFIGAVKAWGWISASCDYTPVAGTHLVKDVLRAEIDVQRALGKDPKRAGLPRVDLDVAATLWADGLPGVSQAPLDEIVRLRRNEEAFDEWRCDLRDVLRLVWESEPGTPQEFEVEFARAVEDRLKPRVEALKAKTKASSSLTTLLLPAALTVGGWVYAATLFPSAPPLVVAGVPVSAVVGTSTITLNWLGQHLFTRFKKSGRRAAQLRQFYGHFIEETPKT